MKQIIYLIIGFLFHLQSTGQVLKVMNEHAYFVYQNEQNIQENGTVIFLHGGVNNPVFYSGETISPDFLLEKNQRFIQLMREKNKKLIIPIVNEKFNWLNDPEKAFIVLQNILKKEGAAKSIFLTGFSDGGTGAYKIFYKHLNFFEGVVIFNGYPQESNFNQEVDYSENKERNIVFASTKRDKQIPYEFLMTEYVKQKKYNSKTYLYLTEGKHSFSDYTYENLKEIMELLTNKDNKQTLTKQPLQGLVYADTLRDFYKYRRAIIRKYAYGTNVFHQNKAQRKMLKKNGLGNKNIPINQMER